jgi:DNA-binding NtrC family response regulator
MASSRATKESILVVDDAPDTLEVLRRNLATHGYKVFTASSVPEAIRIFSNTSIDLVITDYKMPRISGLDLIRHVRENFSDTEIMMITGYSSVAGAVEAMKSGAEEYLAKPFTDDELFTAVDRMLKKLQIRRAGQIHSKKIDSTFYGLIGESKAMQYIFKTISKAAKVNATILITGESGTGKELVARAVHYNSIRASATFVPVNCGGIPEALLESELFGFVKGAFTGASESRAGFFQTAEGGTVFLDEISETSQSMQVKLLRVLQDREVCMVGSSRPRKVDVRIIAATNKDLQNLVNKDVFRQDLFYRLNVLTIDVPPLRNRDDDLLLLARYFVDKFAKELDRPKIEISSDALEALKKYDWPGNIRELENILQRLVVMTDGNLIDVPDLPSQMRFSALRGTCLTRSLAEVEAEYIRNVLANLNGNKTKAAEILGIDRKTLREKLKKIQARPTDQ